MFDLKSYSMELTIHLEIVYQIITRDVGYREAFPISATYFILHPRKILPLFVQRSGRRIPTKNW